MPVKQYNFHRYTSREYPLMIIISLYWCNKEVSDYEIHGAPDKVWHFISIHGIPIFSPNPMSDHLLKSSHRDDSNK